MVNEFNKIVGDVLAAEGAVYLPGIGSLVVVRRAAERISSRRLRRSCNAVLLTDKARGRSVVDAVAAVCGVDEADAWDIYDRWRARSTDDGVLAIDGVGHIDRRRFYVDDAFDRLLNPNGHRVVELVRYRRHRGLRCALWSAAAVAAVVCAVWFTGLYEHFGEAASVCASWFEREPAAAEPDRMGYVAEESEDMAVAEVGAESQQSQQELTDDMTGAAEVAEGDPQPEMPQEAVAEQQSSQAAVAETTRQSEAPAQSERTELAQQPNRPLPQVAQDGVGRLTSGWSYVVSGVFSTPENAMRAVGDARARGMAGCGAFVYGAKYMVALYFSDNAAECSDFIRNARDFDNLWVYTAH